MRFMDWVRVKGDVFKRLLFHFVPKKLEQTFPAISRCSSPIPKILFHFSKQNWNRRNPHILGAFLRFHFFINLYLREKKKEKSVYIKSLLKKTGTIGTTAFRVENHREICVPFCPKKLEQKWNKWNKTGTFAWGHPFSDAVFCVLRRFKPEEVLVYPSGFSVA